MDAGITDGRALGWTDHGVSKFGLQRQVLNTKDNSACCSSLAFILSPQVTAPQVLRSWETFHKDMFPPSFIGILASLAVLMRGCLQSTNSYHWEASVTQEVSVVGKDEEMIKVDEWQTHFFNS